MKTSESISSHIDFEMTDTGKEYWMKPISTKANEMCKHYKGVYMKEFLMPYHLLNHFVEFYNKWWRTRLVIVLNGKLVKTDEK